MRITILRAAASYAAFAVLVGAPACAQQLEIKEPKVEAGEVEIEYLGDYHFGQPRRRSIEPSPGSLLFDDNEVIRQRHSVGIGYGLTNWLGVELGVEAEQERFEEAETLAGADAFDELKVTEIELAATIVLLPAGKHGFTAAALVQHNTVLDRDEARQLFLGTALQYARGPWSATANVYAVKNIGGREERGDAFISDERWDFHYAAQVKYQVNGSFALALEGFGVVERLGNSGTRSEERELFGDFDRHLFGPAVYYSWGGDGERSARKAGTDLRLRAADADDKNGDEPGYSLGAGVLFGLNGDTSDVVLKWALGVEF